MTRIIVTTNCRNVPAKQTSGYVYVLDPESESIRQRSTLPEPPHREYDDNPRGGMRGCRGIAFDGKFLYIANSSSIFQFTESWECVRRIEHPLCACIHEILWHEDQLLATSSRNDLVACFTPDGQLAQVIDMRKMAGSLNGFKWNPPIQFSDNPISTNKIDFRDPRTHRKTGTDLAHLNCVTGHPDGTILLSFGLVTDAWYNRFLNIKTFLLKAGLWKALIGLTSHFSTVDTSLPGIEQLSVNPISAQSAIVKLDLSARSVRHIYSEGGTTIPRHSLLVEDPNTLMYLDTQSSEIKYIRLDDGMVIGTLPIERGFLRGIARYSIDTVVCGNKGNILSIDTAAKAIKQDWQFTKTEDEAVFCIYPLPDHFPLPPKQLGF